jgi:cell division protein FtsW
MLLSSGVNYLYTLYTGIIGVVGSVLMVTLVNLVGKYFLPAHVISRFAVFRNPFSDEFGNGHQLIHGYYAMFNGGLLGRGLGNSIQKKGFLKFAHTDFAFSIVVEELGLIVAIIILGLLFYMIARIILIGIRSNDAFNSMMCIGIGSLFLISVFINLGGITGIIPLTGITFPFISQGGSSLLIFSICIGFVLNISADEKKKNYQLNY